MPGIGESGFDPLQNSIQDVESYGIATEKVLLQIEKAYQKMVKSASESGDEMTEYGKEVARDIQNNFSGLFFDAFTGELKTIGDYFKAFTDSLFKVWSDMLAKMIAESLKLDQIKSSFFSLPSLFGGSTEGVPVTDIPSLTKTTTDIPSLTKPSLTPTPVINYITNTKNYINAIDTQSFDRVLRQNSKSVIGIMALNKQNKGMY